eukprot:Skav234838  [mRNA]  locus=scaffold1428:135350:140785:- [translate_table: standard]
MASRPPTLDELRSALLAKGGTNGDWAEACNGRFSTHEVDWVDGRTFKDDVWAHAQAMMSRGDHVEYVAYDARGRDQGFVVIRLLDWIDLTQGFLKAHHEKASDEYYEYYAGQSLKDGDAAYHLCRGARGRCPSRLPRGDRREVVHLQRWRMMSPMMLVNSGYAAGIGLKLIQDYVDAFSPRVPEPGVPPAGAGGVPVGTGLDAAAAEAAKAAEKVAEAGKSQKASDPPGSAAKNSVGALLEQRAAERRKELLQKKEKEKKKRRSRSRSRKRKRHRSKGSRDSSGSRRTVEAKQKVPGKVAEGDLKGDGPVPRQQVRRGGPGGKLGSLEDDGLRQSSDLDPASGLGDRSEESQGADHSRNKHRPPFGGSSSPVGGSAKPTPESIGELPERAELGSGEAPGADPAHGGDTDERVGTSPGREGRVGKRKAEGDGNEEPRVSQVGTRRRVLPAREAREATPPKPEGRGEKRGPTGELRGEAQDHTDPGPPASSEGSKRRREEGSREVLGESKEEGPELEESQRLAPDEGEPSSSGEDEGDEDEESDASSRWSEQESCETGLVTPSGNEALDILRKWLQKEDVGELSAAQAGAMLALLALRSGTPLGEYLSKMLTPGPIRGERTSRQRSLLPLPLWKDSKEVLLQLKETGEYRRLAGRSAAKKDAKEKASRVMRKNGMLIWHGLVVCLINMMWTGGGEKAPVHNGEITKAQAGALERLWVAVRNFVDDTAESKDKVPKALAVGAWGDRLGDVRINYHGEIIEKAQSLTLAQILPGLPPGGATEEELPDELPVPRVRASPQEWVSIVEELHKRGLVEAVEAPATVRGKPILNGAFGVTKAGKFLEDERPVLRFIMDFRSVNSAMKVLEGDVRSLSGAPSIQHVVLPAGKVLRISADDLCSAFYLFALPPGWSKLMVFRQKVPWRCLGVEKEGETWVGAKVLPMGWASAVGILQHAHRRLALRSPVAGGAGLLGRCEIRRDSIFPDLETEDALWSLYLDDTSLLEIMEARVAEDLRGKPSEEQVRPRKAYAHWGIPVNLEKGLVRAEQAEKLGAVVDGEKGLLRGATKRALDSISLSLWLIRQEKAPRKGLQVLLGREVHTAQFRRPVFAVFDYVWKLIGDGGPLVNLGVKEVEEVLMGGFSQPLRFTDLRASLNAVVTASDASEHGGGMVYGTKLTAKGIKDALLVEEGADTEIEAEINIDKAQKVVVFDFFAGIGGLSRALEMAKVPVVRHVAVEKDKGCRRLYATRWPGAELWSDIEKVRRKDIEKVLRSSPGVTGVVGAGGSPCQGLSKLSVNRKHLQDERSALFYTLKTTLKWVEEVAQELGLWCLTFVENVEGDDADIKEMSDELGLRPIKCCASGLSRVRRPRLFWCNIAMEDHECYTMKWHKLYHEVVFDERPEPLVHVPDPGWNWPAGKHDEDAKLPTFTRAIPRSRPPASPAGISKCSESTLKRWREDRMKYPPYTYAPAFLFAKEGENSRVATCTERERLMGFPTGYTAGLFKKEVRTAADAEEQEVTRCAALGNSVYVPPVACLIDLWLWSGHIRANLLQPRVILQEWHEQMGRLRCEAVGPATRSEESCETESMCELLAEEQLRDRGSRPAEWLRLAAHHGVDIREGRLLATRLVHQYLRRVEFRGSDVRLDLNMIWRPDAVCRASLDPTRWVWKTAQAYRWRRSEHINVLELRAILRSLEWRARTATFHSCRFLHMSDSQICLAVLTKGRSSSRQINRVLRKIHSLCLALNLLPLWAWVASAVNPADEPSRRYAPKA